MAHYTVERVASNIYYYDGDTCIRDGRFLVSRDLFYRRPYDTGKANYFSGRGASFTCQDSEAARIGLTPLFDGLASGRDVIDALEIMRRQSLFMDAARYILTAAGVAAVYDAVDGFAVLERSGECYNLYPSFDTVFAHGDTCDYSDFNPAGGEIDFMGVWERPNAGERERALDCGIGRMRMAISRGMGVACDYQCIDGLPRHRINGFEMLSEEIDNSRGLFYSSTT